MRTFKFSGMIAPQDPFHQITEVSPGAVGLDEHRIAPVTVSMTITNPGPTHVIGVPQYAPPVVGVGAAYDPAGDCDGNFMSYKFQPNNNCYAYGCNITSNTFPQPGRASGNLITTATLTGTSIAEFAGQDGLVFVGTSIDDIRAFALKRTADAQTGGHYVALMISSPGDANWPGDYHWARCDDNINFSSWSQKDGNDQVTNFDFAGQPITNPAIANWTVNQGPIDPPGNTDDLIVDYAFYCYMFVPQGAVNII